MPKSSSAGRKSKPLPVGTVEYLKEWMMSPEHVAHPYPTDAEKAQIMADTGIELNQLTNWFVNNRKRYWKPLIEAKLNKLSAPPSSAAVNGKSSGNGSHHAQVRTAVAQAAVAHQARKKPSSSSGVAVHQAAERPARKAARPSRAASARVGKYVEHNCASSAEEEEEEDYNDVDVKVDEKEGQLQVQEEHQKSREHHFHQTISDEYSSHSAGNSGDEERSLEDEESVSGRSGSSSGGSSGRSNGHPATGLEPVSCGKAAAGYVRSEEVDFHVLRPLEGAAPLLRGDDGEPLPAVRDVRPDVPTDRVVLATFRAPVWYTISYDQEHDRRKIRGRREREVLRLKKHYLRLYLATRGIHSVPQPSDMNQGTEGEKASQDCNPAKLNAAPFPKVTPFREAPTIAALRKRAFAYPDLDEHDRAESKHKRARTAPSDRGKEEWRDLCANARGLFCETLPGLEEAALLFGYSHARCA